jgi:adenylate kinase family enzyme
MKNICFIGAAGSGKSTLATETFTELKKKNYNAELITEFIRSDIQANGPMETIWEQYRIRFSQKEIEDNLPKNLDFAIIDSGTLTQYFYACLYCDHTKPRQRLVLSDMYKYWLDDVYLKRYTHVFWLPAAETYKANPNILTDGTRYQSQQEIDLLESHMELMFNRLHKGVGNVHTIDGPLNGRLQKVLDILI